MKKLTIILLAAVVYGCKVNKEKQKLFAIDTQHQVAVRSNNDAWQFNSKDSSYRYLFYTGDSAFFFHPDIGLWSRSGQISYAEQRATQEEASGVMLQYDSISTEKKQSTSQTHTMKATTPSSKWLWVLTVIPLVALIYWCWRRIWKAGLE